MGHSQGFPWMTSSSCMTCTTSQRCPRHPLGHVPTHGGANAAGGAITLFNDKSSPEEDVYLLWAKKVGDKFDVVLATASCTSHLDWSGICAAFVGTVATGAAVVMCPHLAGIGVPLVGGGLAALTCKAASRPDFHNVVRGFMLSELATIGLLQLPCQPEQTPLAPLTLQRRGPTL